MTGTNTKKPAADQKDIRAMMRMKDLTAATGLPKSTILHYVHEGLLPRPVKTGPNMAYYHPSCVERIACIKHLQAKHRLPLASIKGLLSAMDKGRDLTPLIELQEYLFQGPEGERLNQKSFCEVTGLSPEQVETCLTERILVPLEEGWFDDEDVAVGRLLKLGRELGITAGDVVFYPRLADEIVDHEMALRNHHTAGMDFKQKLEATMEFTRMGRALRAYIIDRIFQKRVISMIDEKDESD